MVMALACNGYDKKKRKMARVLVWLPVVEKRREEKNKLGTRFLFSNSNFTYFLISNFRFLIFDFSINVNF